MLDRERAAATATAHAGQLQQREHSADLYGTFAGPALTTGHCSAGTKNNARWPDGYSRPATAL